MVMRGLAVATVDHRAHRIATHAVLSQKTNLSSDVLNKVQSDIGAGEDAATALQRLMDWSEARQVKFSSITTDLQAAIKAFEAEESETPVAPRAQSVAASSSHRNTGPQRPSSAPVPEGRGRRDAPGPSSLRNDAMDAEESTNRNLSVRNPASATSILERSPTNTVNLPGPSSSPLPSPSHPRAIATQPLRNQRTIPRVPSSSNVPTSSTFNFALPTSLTIPSLELPPASGSAQSVSVGSKRPIVDAEMAEGPSTPVRGQGRHGSKRRSMGLGVQDDEKERGSERRRGRRGGLGGGGHGPSPL